MVAQNCNEHIIVSTWLFLMGILNWPAVFQSLSVKTSGEFDQPYFKKRTFLGVVLGGSPGQITALEILIPLVSTLHPLLHRRKFSL
jgi:hypothetical protein